MKLFDDELIAISVISIIDIWITVSEKVQHSILTLHVPRIYYKTCELPTSRLGQTKMNTCHKVCFVTYINHNCRFIFMRYYNMDSYFYNRGMSSFSMVNRIWGKRFEIVMYLCAQVGCKIQLTNKRYNRFDTSKHIGDQWSHKILLMRNIDQDMMRRNICDIVFSIRNNKYLVASV